MLKDVLRLWLKLILGSHWAWAGVFGGALLGVLLARKFVWQSWILAPGLMLVVMLIAAYLKVVFEYRLRRINEREGVQ